MLNAEETKREFTEPDINKKKSLKRGCLYHQEIYRIGKYTNLLWENVIVIGQQEGTKFTADIILCEC
jgi:hypothetical protein